ncbi:MAG: tyrosine-type recombinase/integrase [Actinomycetota bacterium]|nr:tyrosine-type recombinase/integrase [Actinomycetota bacterium]
MPVRPTGVYRDRHGGWYVKVTTGRDPLTGRRRQLTRRGFATAAEAAKARRALLAGSDAGMPSPAPGKATTVTVAELVAEYLDGIDMDGKLAAKTRNSYRDYACAYVLPHLGQLNLGEVTGEVVLAWQRRLIQGGARDGTGLAPNTIRLARAPLAGAFKLAVVRGLVAANPLVGTPRPTPKRAVPRHWSPEQARAFLDIMDGDRTWPIWAFLLGSGVRIGELVWLRWANVDFAERRVRIVEFASSIGYTLVASEGKSRDAIRAIDLDDGAMGVLRAQQDLQARDAQVPGYIPSDYVFTKATGGAFHPQYLSQLLGRLSVEAGLPRLTAHGLRHTSATLMLASGVPAKVAAERLGHADPALFMNLYSHVTPTMQREAAERIGAVLFGS